MDSLKFANIIFKGLRKMDLLSEESHLKFIVTANAEFIVKANEDKKFHQILNENYTTFDGQIPYILAKRQYSDINFEKLSGSDLIYDFCEMAQQKNKKVFLLGGFEESNRLAVQKLREKYIIQIVGYSPPYRPYPFEAAHNEMIIENIKAFTPDILFVGFGAVKQEFWIEEHKQL
ncbi:MAG: WecB/TagA/CpsF family glycosyltransferase, partial [Campylobacterales bacterium]|nr:WecB/TagA/CpsF family glycosyltransferase [Campylobacterales bacterium]